MQLNTGHVGQTTAAPVQEADTASGTSDIDDFIYLISHDVRASVRALLELPQWIKEDLEESGVKLDGSVASSIDLMNRHTSRLDRMLVDLLSYSRVGRMQVTGQQHLETVLAEVKEQMHIPSGFAVTHDFKCSHLTIGDRDLPLLLDALISNGIKHHDRDTGRIHISSEHLGSHVLLRVEDDGPGIEEQFHERVFSPMTTLRPRDKVEGSGMGLANTQRISRHYGGTARIAPHPVGRSTCIEVTIAQPTQS